MIAAREIIKVLTAGGTQTDDSVERILDHALAVIREFGFRRSSMEDFARKAGISRVTLYRRFSDRDALIQAVLLRECRRSLIAIVNDISAIKSPEERFVRGFVATVTVARSHPLFQKMLEGDADIVLPKSIAITTSQAIDLGRAYMSGIIAGLQKKGQFPRLDPEYTAELLIRMWHSLVLTPSSKIASDESKSLTEFARQYLYPLLARGNR